MLSALDPSQHPGSLLKLSSKKSILIPEALVPTLLETPQHCLQDCYRVLVSIISWPGQLLSLNPCQRPKILARMLFGGILSLTIVILEIKAYKSLKPTKSVLWTSCVVIFIRDVSIAQR